MSAAQGRETTGVRALHSNPRQIIMLNHWKRFLAAAPLLLAVLAPAYATVLTFEDLDPSPASYDVMPATYNGFSFAGWYFGPDTFYTPASGTIDLFTDYFNGDPNLFVITQSPSITSVAKFYFDGAWFSGYSGVTFELFRDGALVHTSTTLPDAADVDPYGPVLLASGYSGLIDEIRVTGVQGYFALDDFTYRRDAVVSVPEPSALLLAALGLGGLFLVRRRTTFENHQGSVIVC